VALGATIAWWLADAFAGAKYSSRFSFWWNSTVHFAAFVINAVTIAKIKLDLRQRHELAAKLEAARQTLRAAARVLPSCPLWRVLRYSVQDTGIERLSSKKC